MLHPSSLEIGPDAQGDETTSSAVKKARESGTWQRRAAAVPAICCHKWKQSKLGSKFCLSLAALFALLFVISFKLHPSSKHAAPLARRTKPCTTADPCYLFFIADLDTRSRIEGAKRQYQSKLMTGTLSLSGQEVDLRLSSEEIPVIGKLAEEDRGMELSELVTYNGQMLSFDDRSGIMFELLFTEGAPTGLRGGNPVKPLPDFVRAVGPKLLNNTNIQVTPVAKAVLAEGDGVSSMKGMKIEWATEKDGSLYIGSFGKEFTNAEGEIVSEANFWVGVLEENGHIARLDWKPYYNKLRDFLGISFPGYMIHEAVNWSPARKRWVFLPRRVSKEPYNEDADEQRGSKIILVADEDFKTIESISVAFPEQDPARGFSSFKFLPGTNDEVIVALRSAEAAAEGKQMTYISVFDALTGKIYASERVLSATEKFEGVEIW